MTSAQHRERAEERFNAAWQMVTCAGCGTHFRCTPGSDYYNNTTDSDGVCERCLLSGEKGASPPDPEVVSPLLQKMIDDPATPEEDR